MQRICQIMDRAGHRTRIRLRPYILQPFTIQRSQRLALLCLHVLNEDLTSDISGTGYLRTWQVWFLSSHMSTSKRLKIERMCYVPFVRNCVSHRTVVSLLIYYHLDATTLWELAVFWRGWTRFKFRRLRLGQSLTRIERCYGRPEQ